MSLVEMKAGEIEGLAKQLSESYLNAMSTTYQTLTEQWNRLSTPLAQQRAEALQAFEQDFRRMAGLADDFANAARSAGNTATANTAQIISDHFAQKANAILDPVVTTSQKLNSLASGWADSTGALSREVRTFGESFVRKLGPIADLANSAEAWSDFWKTNNPDKLANVSMGIVAAEVVGAFAAAGLAVLGAPVIAIAVGAGLAAAVVGFAIQELGVGAAVARDARNFLAWMEDLFGVHEPKTDRPVTLGTGTDPDGDGTADSPTFRMAFDVLQKFQQAAASWLVYRIDPLALDLNGDGAIQLIQVANSQANFDLNADGVRERVGWIGPNDGFLALDANGDGKIVDVSELFGSDTQSGFAELAQYDLAANGGNGDGKIDASDAVFAELQVWRDLNSDGSVNFGELRPVTDYEIKEISLAFTPFTLPGSDPGTIITETGTFKLNDGTIRTAGDALLQRQALFDGAYTPVDETTAAQGLPNFRGFGSLRDLRQSASLSDGFVGSIGTLLSGSPQQMMDGMDDILYRWAGTQNAAAGSRGAFIDARRLGALEVLMGTPFRNIQTGANPNAGPAGLLNDAWTQVREHYAARFLVFGTWFHQLFPNAAYSPATDFLVLNEDPRNVGQRLRDMRAAGDPNVDTAVALLPMVYRESESGRNDLLLLDGSAGSSATSTVTGVAFTDLGDGADFVTMGALQGLHYTGLGNDSLTFTNGGEHTIINDGGDDVVLSNAPGDFVFYAAGGNNRLSLKGGQDVISTGAGNDIIDLGSGDHFIDAGDGNNNINTNLVTGQVGNSLITTGLGNDLIGSASGIALRMQGDVTIRGGDGWKRIWLGNGRHDIELGTNNTSQTSVVDLGDGDATVRTLNGNQSIRAGAGSHSITTGSGSDQIDLGSGNHVINAGDGNNNIDTNLVTGQVGTVSITTGLGDDLVGTATAVAFRMQGEVTIRGGDGWKRIWLGNGTHDIQLGNNTTAQTSIVDLGDGNSHVVTGDGSQTIKAGAGDHVITTRAGNDIIDLGSGNHVISAGDGNNSINTNLVTSQTGTVSIFTGAGSDLIGTGTTIANRMQGAITIHAGDGWKRIWLGNGTHDIQLGNNTTAQTNIVDLGDGNSHVVTGDGSQTIKAGAGDHVITTRAGNDIIDLGSGNHVISAGDGNNNINTNVVTGQTGTVSIVTGGGSDLIGTGTIVSARMQGDVTVSGGDGWKRIWLGNGKHDIQLGNNATGQANVIDLGNGDALIVTGNGTQTIKAGSGDHAITTGSGNDVIDLGSGNHVIRAGDGNNFINTNVVAGQAGTVSLFTGGGSDLIGTNTTLPNRMQGDVTIRSGDGWKRIWLGDGKHDIQLGNNASGQVNVIDLGNGDARVVTGDGTQGIRAGSGSHVVITGSGGDTIDVGSGDHVINAGDGNNLINLNIVAGQTGTMSITTGSGNDIIGSSTPALSLRMQGAITVSAGDGNNQVYLGDGTHHVTTGAGTDVIETGGGNDSVNSGGGSDTVRSGAGNDELAGGQGNDRLEGAMGSDVYLFDRGDGQDVVSDFGWNNATSQVDTGVDTLRFGAGIAFEDLGAEMSGSNLAFTVSASTDRVSIENWNGVIAGSFAWRLENLEFSDGARLSLSDLQVATSAGGTLSGGAGQSAMFGASGNDVLNGDSGDDFLSGGAGNDTLRGGIGADRLAGGSGNDTYLFDPGFGADTIVDSDATPGNTDVIRFGTGISPAGVAVSRAGQDLLLSVAADRITIKGWYGSDASKIERVEFANGTVWAPSQVEAMLNHAPTVAIAVSDATANEDEPFSLQLPSGTFADTDAGDTLSYSATLANGSSLPTWLHFEAATATFTGTPGQQDVGSIELSVTATDSGGLSVSDGFTLTVANTNDEPVVSASNAQLLRNQSVAAASLFSVVDADGDLPTQYEFWDDVEGGGYWSVNGVQQSANHAISVGASDLPNTTYSAGSEPGTEQVWVRAFDATGWSAWRNWSITTALHIPNAAPEVSAQPNQVVLFDQAVDASSLFSVADADGDPVTRYEFFDSTAGNGHFSINGLEQGVNVSIGVAAADLANTQFVSASGFGADLVWVRATDGQTWGNWKSWTLQSAPHATNSAPVVSAADSEVLTNQSIAATLLFTVTDPDSDAITQYELWDDVEGGGYWSLAGVQQSAAHSIAVSPTDLANTVYLGGATPGTERVWMRANDGMAWSAWKPWNMTTALHVPNAAPEVSAQANQVVLFGQGVDASTLFSVADADGDPVTRYEFWDSTAGNGHFAVNGVEQGVNVAIGVSAADLPQTQFVGGFGMGSDLVWVRASDGQAWGSWKSWNMQSAPHATNSAPVVAASDMTLVTNEAAAASSLFSVTDADGDAATQYELWDDVNGGGYWRVNGVQQGAAHTIAVSAADLANTRYVAGAAGGTEQVWARAYDGMAWSTWKPWKITSALHVPNAAPVVSAASQTVLLNQSVDASALFSVTDADDDAITQYEFWDSTPGGGHFTVDGVEAGVNVSIAVTAAQLATTQFVGGAASGTDTVWARANDGQTWSDWKSWYLQSSPHLTNATPVVSAAHNGLLRNETVAADSLFSVSDADGDAITQYQFWDDVNGGGYWSLDGVQQAAGQNINVSAAQLASLDYVGGANAGTEQVWARANDGIGWGAWKNWLMSTEGGMVRGGAGPDTLNGDASTPVLEGNGGDDTLNAGESNSLLSGGDGSDQLNGGAGDDFLAGGSGDDTVQTGAGANVIAFNAGGGTDTVFSDAVAANTVSLGGGIRYEDLNLSKDGNDLVLAAGDDDKLVLKDWYAGKDDVANLQLILDATPAFDPNSQDALYNRKVQTFDFRGLVSAFDEARAQSPGLTSWQVTNALLQYHLSASDDAALGGDLAYWYGKNGSLSGMGVQSVQQAIGATGFGSDAQQLHAFSGLQDGFVKLA